MDISIPYSIEKLMSDYFLSSLQAEIQKVKSLGVSSDLIIYANPCKTNSYIRYAASQGVTCMTFDNATELYKIKQNFPSAE